jgi:SAM-dependent MidA family methyltransferase
MKLPDIDNLPAAQTHSERLCVLIRNDIAANGGQITFARYMDLALYAPGLGYYSAGSHKLGEAGDFVTAPELSPLFSRCVARQCEQVLAHLGGGDILEVGAGSGVMAADVLAELEALDCLPGCYFILEVSADLRQRQQQMVAARVPHLAGRVYWLDALPVAGFQGVVLANELLDAMPVHVFGVAEKASYERYVACGDGRFIWSDGPLSDARLAERIVTLAEARGEFAPGYISEINLAAEAWLRSIAALLTRGMVLLIDYGFPRHEYYHAQRNAGTLMCHYRHRAHPDPLILPGLQDITAHVDFTALAEVASKVGLTVAGFTTQAYFLLSSGLNEMTGMSDPNDVRQHVLLMQQVKKLTLPSEMGELFKVMALTRDVDVPLLGFTFQDQRRRL